MPNLSEFTSLSNFTKQWERAMPGDDVVATTARSLNDAHRRKLQVLLVAGAASNDVKVHKWSELAALSSALLDELDAARINIAKLDRERAEVYKLHSQQK